ncbi:hypothetical protein BGZ46_006897 [Entomortierella lignicola]|nr:hypothetical protein BGZ46_006897 [Entomortierella lignicola]
MASNKSSLTGNLNGAVGSGNNGVHNHVGSSNGGHSLSTSSSTSFLDFAGNSRYQAYNLARFSTYSVASSSTSTKTQGPVSIIQTHNQSEAASTSNAHSNPADTESQSPSSTSLTKHDDKEDDWAVNESYSGHGGDFTSISSTSESDHNSQLIESSTPSNSHPSRIYDESDPNYDSHKALRPSSSFNNPTAIEASWRRTSDSLPSVVSPTVATALPQVSSNKAGGLDLSSSTLVQQMLFKERAPHSDNSQEDGGNRNQSDEGNSSANNSQHTNEDFTDWDDEDQSTERKHKSISEKYSSSEKVTFPSIKQDKKSSNEKQEEVDDHISKLDIRVGIVRSVTAHPDAESLYIEKVDIGDKEGDQYKEPRTIVSGLVRHVPKDYLEGRAVIVVGNMKPSKLRGVVSQGMLLCAMEQNPDGQVIKVGLLEPAEGSQPGDKIIFENYTDETTVPASVLTPKRKWFEKSQIHFSVRDGVAYYKGSPFKTVRGLVRCRSISEGQVS